ncbi:VOC family protein [Paracoccus xiamenensis]|uniref:VOC family protein n=1 Tax=Paracoccus xiamenensis TaxID=2714901 RepID=UPI00140BD1A8|nr:VOC family protein [Paracoccus xiamenensis]NHF73978.1 VOC family protein [Paracoccus xiamenensis]
MTHRARLGCIVIDCKAEHVAEAARFWGVALGGEVRIDEDGKYAEILDQGDLKVLVQAVDHDARVHIDLEADDKDAEVARLKSLGGKVVNRVKRWIVMEAPTGHRFCVVDPQGPAFEANAREVE